MLYKFYSKLISCLGTGWEPFEKIKINYYIIENKQSYSELLVSVMSNCSKTFSLDFL